MNTENYVDVEYEKYRIAAQTALFIAGRDPDDAVAQARAEVYKNGLILIECLRTELADLRVRLEMKTRFGKSSPERAA